MGYSFLKYFKGFEYFIVAALSCFFFVAIIIFLLLKSLHYYYLLSFVGMKMYFLFWDKEKDSTNKWISINFLCSENVNAKHKIHFVFLCTYENEIIIIEFYLTI